MSGRHAAGYALAHHGGTRTELLAPYRLLAWRVIALAMRDLESAGLTQRNSALAFLSGSQMLDHWCELADLDAAAIRARVLHVLDSQAFTPLSGKGH